MPHERKRHVLTLIKKALSHSSIVGVLGQRQVGKTTLVSALSQEYETFDKAAVLDLAFNNPDFFIENRRHPFGVDEAQLCPPLFPALKEWVRIYPKKGQVILTGSVRFTSRKAIRESLTGRIVNVEVLPFTISELNSLPITHFISDFFSVATAVKLEKLNESYAKKKESAFKVYLEKGGLPGICFYRDASVREDRFEAHVDTLLSRDLQLILQTTTTPVQLKNLARFLAEKQGNSFSLQEASHYSGISTITVKKLLIALEALFLIRSVPCEGGVTKPCYYFEDQGVASFCAKAPFQKTTDILRGVYANLRQELFYSKSGRGEIFSFRTHDGTDVPLVFQTSKNLLGIIPVEGDQITRKAIESGRSFLKHYRNGKVIYAYTGKIASTKDFQAFAVPYWWLV